MNANDKFLKAFFEEKEVKEQTFEFTLFNGTHEGTTHLVESGFVIDLIKSTQGDEQAALVNIIRKIDFANGDINHFLKHLAEGYVKTNY